jgi:hypothetical protein
MESKESLRAKFGHGYEVLIGQDLKKANDLYDYLAGVPREGVWIPNLSEERIIRPLADQAVDLRQFVVPGLYSPEKRDLIPGYRFVVRDGDVEEAICIDWEKHRVLLDSHAFETIYGKRFPLFDRCDYRDLEIPERHCGDNDDEGC